MSPNVLITVCVIYWVFTAMFPIYGALRYRRDIPVTELVLSIIFSPIYIPFIAVLSIKARREIAHNREKTFYSFIELIEKDPTELHTPESLRSLLSSGLGNIHIKYLGPQLNLNRPIEIRGQNIVIDLSNTSIKATQTRVFNIFNAGVALCNPIISYTSDVGPESFTPNILVDKDEQEGVIFTDHPDVTVIINPQLYRERPSNEL